MGAALGPAGGAGMGALKTWAVDRPKENRQRNLAANMNYYDKMVGDNAGAQADKGMLPQETSVYENMMKGAGMGQQQQDANSWQGMMKGGGNPTSGATDMSQGGMAGGGDELSLMKQHGGIMGEGESPWSSMMTSGGVPFIPV